MLLSPQQRRILLDVARGTIRERLGVAPSDAAAAPQPATPPAGSDPATDPALLQPAGCFVSLHRMTPRRLRGCVGKLDAADPLLHAVRAAATAVLDDPRFRRDPVRPAELPDLDLEISVLSPLQPAAHALDFDLLNDGIYLVYGGRAGCFLPQVARETGWSREQLLARLCTEKLGCAPTAWQDPQSKLFVFSTLLLGPERFEPAA